MSTTSEFFNKININQEKGSDLQKCNEYGYEKEFETLVPLQSCNIKSTFQINM